MNKLKNKFLIALIFGLYQMLICLFFGTSVFLDSSVNLGVYLGVVFAFITIIQLVTLFVISKTKYSLAKQSIFFSISFMISAVIGGSLSYFTIASNFQNYLIYIASFLISAFLPTVFFLLKFIYEDAANRISDLKKVSLKESSTQPNTEPIKLFHLENENGKLLLEVPVDRIICYEANDNYVVTYYLDKQNIVKRSMERVSLKRIEELLALENVAFFRVHKSYLINPDFLEEIKGKAQAYKLKLREFDTLVPVSRSYDISSLEKRMF
jgi:hypothetical protein